MVPLATSLLTHQEHKIAYASNRDGDDEIYVLDLERAP